MLVSPNHFDGVRNLLEFGTQRNGVHFSPPVMSQIDRPTICSTISISKLHQA